MAAKKKSPAKSTFGKKKTPPKAAKPVNEEVESPSAELPADPQTETPEQARLRTQQCGEAVQAVLERFRCEIVPFIAGAEPVGQHNTRIMLTASYGILPL